MSKTEYVQIKDAARLLGITVSTVHAWIRRGRIHQVEREAIVTVPCIPVSDLKKAFIVKCRQCGKAFRAKHPLKAAFCSVDHRNAWFRANALKGMPRRPVGRPRMQPRLKGPELKRLVVK